MRRASLLPGRAFLVGALVLAMPMVGVAGRPKHPRKKPELLRKHQAELNAIAARRAFTFEAPPDFTVVPVSDKNGPAFSATLESAHAAMLATIDKGAVPISDLALTEEALQRIERWKTEHPLGSAKLVKKAVTKHELGPAMRLVFELRSGENLEKPTRELVWILSTTSHNARIVYTAPTAAHARLEKAFDASARKTTTSDAPKAEPKLSLEPTIAPAP